MTISAMPQSLTSVLETLGLTNAPNGWNVSSTETGITLTLEWTKDGAVTSYTSPLRTPGMKSPSTLLRDYHRRQAYVQKLNGKQVSHMNKSPVDSKTNSSLPVTTGSTCQTVAGVNTCQSVSSQTDGHSIPKTVSVAVQSEPVSMSSGTQDKEASIQKVSISTSVKKVTEKVLKRRKCFDSEQFLIQWKDHPGQCNAWINSVDLDERAKEFIQNKGHKIRGKCNISFNTSRLTLCGNSEISVLALGNSCLSHASPDDQSVNSKKSSELSKQSSSNCATSVHQKPKNIHPPFEPRGTYNTNHGVMTTLTVENPYHGLTSNSLTGTETVAFCVEQFLSSHNELSATDPSEVGVYFNSKTLGRTLSVNPQLRLNQIPPQWEHHPMKKHAIELQLVL